MRIRRLVGVGLVGAVILGMFGCGKREPPEQTRSKTQMPSPEAVSSRRPDTPPVKPESQSLLVAVKNGRVSDVRLFLADESTRPQVHSRDDEGRTPLHYAASHDQAEIASLLLDNGADINALDNENRTPIDGVSVNVVLLGPNKGDMEIAPVGKLLLRKGAKSGKDLSSNQPDSTRGSQNNPPPSTTEQATEAKPSEDPFEQALALCRAGEGDEAIKLARKAVAKKPDDMVNNAISLATVCATAGDFAGAAGTLRDFLKGKQEMPSNDGHQISFGKAQPGIFGLLAFTAEAYEKFDQLITGAPTPEVQASVRQGCIHLKSAMTDKAKARAAFLNAASLSDKAGFGDAATKYRKVVQDIDNENEWWMP